jgi:hypothetical protein
MSGFIMAFAAQLTALAWFGIRRGERWALWTAAGSAVLAYLIAVRLHFVYGLATPFTSAPLAWSRSC